MLVSFQRNIPQVPVGTRPQLLASAGDGVVGSGKNGTGENGTGKNGTRKKWLPELTAPEKRHPVIMDACRIWKVLSAFGKKKHYQQFYHRLQYTLPKIFK